MDHTLKKSYPYLFCFIHFFCFSLFSSDAPLLKKTLSDYLWVQTSDNAILPVNVYKDLLGGGVIKYLFKKFFKRYRSYNSETQPLKIGLSAPEYLLFRNALLELHCNSRTFTYNEQTQQKLTEMASAFKSHKLYTALFHKCVEDPYIKHLIASTLIIHMNHNIFKEILYKCISLNNKSITWNLPTEIEQTHDGKYYIASVNNNIHIYNANTHLLIIQIPKKIHFSLCKTKNALLIHPSDEDPSLFWYDIDNNDMLTLHNNAPTTHFAKISPSEKHVALVHDDYITLWTIGDLYNATSVSKQCHGADEFSFSKDGTFIATGPKQHYSQLILWHIHDNELEYVDHYNNCSHGPIFFIGDEYIAINESSVSENTICRILKIKKHKNTFKLDLFLRLTPGSPYFYINNTHKPCKHFFIYYNPKNQTLSIHNKRMRSIYTREIKHTPTVIVSNNERHVVVTDNKNRSSMLHFEKITDYGTYYTHKAPLMTPSNPMTTFLVPIESSEFNKQSSLFLQQLNDTVTVYDTTWGAVLKRYHLTEETQARFHPNGRKLLIGNTSHSLYDKKTKRLIKEIDETITTDAFFLLRKICRQQNPFVLKNNFYRDLFNGLDDTKKNFYSKHLHICLPCTEKK